MDFHLAFELAKLGYIVVLFDFDPQMNLTQIAMRKIVEAWHGQNYPDFEGYYAAHQGGANSMPNNIYEALKPVIELQNRPIKAARCFRLLQGLVLEDGETLPGRDTPGKLLLVAGHSELTEFETQLTAAYRTNGNTDSQTLFALDDLIGKTATHYQADFVLVDSSPAKGVLNQHVVCMSDYLILPSAPDYFSYEAFRKLKTLFPEWLKKKHHLLRNRDPEICAPQHVRAAVARMRNPRHGVPKILGGLLSRFQMINHRAVNNSQHWIDMIDNFMITEFRDELSNIQIGNGPPMSMILPDAVANPVRSILVDGSDGEPLGHTTMLLILLRDFYQLNSLSQIHCVPVTGLTMDEMTKWDDDGRLRKMPEKHAEDVFRRVDAFQQALRTLAENVVKLTADPPGPAAAGA